MKLQDKNQVCESQKWNYAPQQTSTPSELVTTTDDFKSESGGRGGAGHADDKILLRTVHIFQI
jgi:hypothetical protein